MPNFSQLVLATRAVFNTGKTKAVEWRRQQLEAMLLMLTEKSEDLFVAMKSDLNKSPSECKTFEVEFVKNDIIYALNNLDSWIQPESAKKGMAFMMDTACVKKEPFGVALIIGSWNYPIQVPLLPMVGAIAAGNCVVVKPSEGSPATAEVLARIFPEYMDKECIHIVNGAVAETTALLEERWDYVFYTGSTVVGKIIYQAAAKHLTPVTLELGGKSPVYVDKNSNLDIVAKRLCWGKFVNNGQTCVAPDYVLCTKEVQDELIPKIEKVVKEYYGENPAESSSYGRIVNERHVQRLQKLLEGGGRIALGGQVDVETKYLSPTVMADCKPDDLVMKEEIFGPIVAFMPIGGEEEAINYINAGDKPLTMYLFSHDQSLIQRFLENTSSGSVCANDCLLQGGLETLPFGGVGNSGIGSYHGKFTFDTFSHKKAVLLRAQNMEALLSMRYPPYNESKDYRLALLTTKSKKRKGLLSFLPW